MVRKPGYSIEHDSWFIPLTQGVIALVDADQVPILSQHNWCAHKQGRQWRASRYVSAAEGDTGFLRMHRAVLGAIPGTQVDHIRHHPLSDRVIDNRRSNLRICSHSENQRNQRPKPGGTSRFKGVCWHKNYKKWQAQIFIDGSRKYLGRFKDETEAAHAYDVAAKENFGEFAHLNFG